MVDSCVVWFSDWSNPLSSVLPHDVFVACSCCPEHYYPRHANSHFEDDEVQRDMEMAQQAAVAEVSTSGMAVFLLVYLSLFSVSSCSCSPLLITNSGVFKCNMWHLCTPIYHWFC
jgi:hypothetical protein